MINAPIICIIICRHLRVEIDTLKTKLQLHTGATDGSAGSVSGPMASVIEELVSSARQCFSEASLTDHRSTFK
jgi:hypothetical protein